MPRFHDIEDRKKSSFARCALILEICLVRKLTLLHLNPLHLFLDGLNDWWLEFRVYVP